VRIGTNMPDNISNQGLSSPLEVTLNQTEIIIVDVIKNCNITSPFMNNSVAIPLTLSIERRHSLFLFYDTAAEPNSFNLVHVMEVT